MRGKEMCYVRFCDIAKYFLSYKTYYIFYCCLAYTSFIECASFFCFSLSLNIWKRNLSICTVEMLVRAGKRNTIGLLVSMNGR